MFQILEKLPVRAVRWVTVTMTVLTKMERRRDNEGREPTSHPSSCRSWRLSLLGIDTQTCQLEKRFPCGPTWQNQELGWVKSSNFVFIRIFEFISNIVWCKCDGSVHICDLCCGASEDLVTEKSYLFAARLPPPLLLRWLKWLSSAAL